MDNEENTGRFECFGAIKNYHREIGGLKVRDKVKADLASMAAKGQKRLRIPIRHGYQADHFSVSACSFNGTLFMDAGYVLSHDGLGNPGHSNYDLDGVQQIENMKYFLADIVEAGFSEVVIGFFPHGLDDPLNWGTTWHDFYYKQNRNYIFNLRNQVFDEIDSLNYTIDLLNEGAPESSNTLANPRARYVKTLWREYNSLPDRDRYAPGGCGVRMAALQQNDRFFRYFGKQTREFDYTLRFSAGRRYPYL